MHSLRSVFKRRPALSSPVFIPVQPESTALTAPAPKVVSSLLLVPSIVITAPTGEQCLINPTDKVSLELPDVLALERQVEHLTRISGMMGVEQPASRTFSDLAQEDGGIRLSSDSIVFVSRDDVPWPETPEMSLTEYDRLYPARATMGNGVSNSRNSLEQHRLFSSQERPKSPLSKRIRLFSSLRKSSREKMAQSPPPKPSPKQTPRSTNEKPYTSAPLLSSAPRRAKPETATGLGIFMLPPVEKSDGLLGMESTGLFDPSLDSPKSTPSPTTPESTQTQASPQLASKPSTHHVILPPLDSSVSSNKSGFSLGTLRSRFKTRSQNHLMTSVASSDSSQSSDEDGTPLSAHPFRRPIASHPRQPTLHLNNIDFPELHFDVSKF